MATTIRLLSMRNETNFAPLGVLGYCLMRSDFLAPVFRELELDMKTVAYAPAAKLIDILVSILVGCRAIAQVNTRLRPDLALAQAWGRRRFAEQSTLTRTLDGFDEASVKQLRQGGEALLHGAGRVFRHNFAQEWLWLDIDLTPLPISKLAEASTKGKFAKKTVTVGNSPVSMRRNIMRPCFRATIPANRIVAQRIFQSWKRWKPHSASRLSRSNTRFCVRMRALVEMSMSIMHSRPTGTSSPKAKAASDRRPMPAKSPRRLGIPWKPAVGSP